MRRNGGNIVRWERIYICSLVRKQDKGNVLSTSKMCTFFSLRLLICMAEASRSRMTQDLRHNLEGGSSLHITYIGFSRAYKRALSSSADAHFQLSIVRIWRSVGAEEQGPAEVQVGTGEEKVSTANPSTQ
jgi:hypothetical protein